MNKKVHLCVAKRRNFGWSIMLSPNPGTERHWFLIKLSTTVTTSELVESISSNNIQYPFITACKTKK